MDCFAFLDVFVLLLFLCLCRAVFFLPTQISFRNKKRQKQLAAKTNKPTKNYPGLEGNACNSRAYEIKAKQLVVPGQLWIHSKF